MSALYRFLQRLDADERTFGLVAAVIFLCLVAAVLLSL